MYVQEAKSTNADTRIAHFNWRLRNLWFTIVHPLTYAVVTLSVVNNQSPIVSQFNFGFWQKNTYLGWANHARCTRTIG